MELEGSLKAFSLPEILQFLAMGKLTGTLMVRRDHQGIDLVIRQGRIVNSSTADKSRRLGQMLVYRRLIHRSDLDEVLYEQRTTHPDRMLGQLLIERDLISADDLREVIRSQLEEEIWELFSWEDGEFRFEHHSESDIREVLVELDIEPLIIEGTRRIDEWKAIIRSLKGDRTVLGLRPWNPEERAELTLTPAEWQVLAHINGRSSVGAIAARTGIGRFETYRILSTFLQAGIACIKEDPTEQAGEGDSEQAGSATGADDAQVAQTSRGLGFFGKRRSNEVSLKFGESEVFPTALGLIARFVDLVVLAAFEHRDFSFTSGDERFLERQWRDIVMDYPMADLVQVEGNTVDVRPLERYLELGGICEATLWAYEDALEALGRLYAVTSAVFSQRMGERAFQRVVQMLKSEWLPRTRVEQEYKFDFDKFLERSLAVAGGER